MAGEKVCRPALLLLLVTACRSSPPEIKADAGDASPAAAAPIDASAPPPSASPVASAESPQPCVTTKLQPGRCATGPGPLKGERFKKWFVDQGVVDPGDLKKIDDVSPDGCDEARFDEPTERVLACQKTEPVPVDPTRGMSAPMQTNVALRVFAVRDHRLVDLVTVPIGVETSEADGWLFGSRYVVNHDRRSVTVAIAKGDCHGAGARLATYWDAKIAEVRRAGGPDAKELVRLHELERPMGKARIDAICAGAGEYVETQGRLVR